MSQPKQHEVNGSLVTCPLWWNIETVFSEICLGPAEEVDTRHIALHRIFTLRNVSLTHTHTHTHTHTLPYET